MLLSIYQITDILIGSIIFPILYLFYLKMTTNTIIVWDIIWCTMAIFFILLFKNFYINYNILQSQNFSSNIILNGIY